MAITEVYVDPAIAANSGTGTSGDPYGDLQYAMNQTTLGTDGTRFNIKAGTDEILTAALSLATHGTPTTTAPVIFQGYTTSAGDGGVGGIEGTTNSVQIISSTALDYIYFRDMDLVGNTASDLIRLDNQCGLYNVFAQNTGSGGVAVIDNGIVSGCELVSGGGVAAQGFGLAVEHCYIRNTGSTGGQVLSNSIIAFNVIALDLSGQSNTEAVAFTGDTATAIFNTIKATATPGTNVWGMSVARLGCFAANNYIENFAGTSGGGIQIEAGGEGSLVVNNYYHNNTTNETDATGTVQFINGTSLGSSAIDSNFLPASSLQALAYPTTFRGLASTPNKRDIGAVQHTDAGGGGGTTGRQGLHAIESGGV